MTIKELIKNIETLPDDMKVMTTAYGGKPHEITAAYIIKHVITDEKSVCLV